MKDKNGNSRHTEEHFDQGVAYCIVEAYDRAIESFTNGISINPQDELAYNNRGVAWFRKRNLDRAFEDFTNAIEASPQYAVAYLNRGRVYEMRDDFDGEIVEYNKAIEFDPYCTDAYYHRGMAKRLRKDHLKDEAGGYKDLLKARGQGFEPVMAGFKCSFPEKEFIIIG